jgi:hypothetical protein
VALHSTTLGRTLAAEELQDAIVAAFEEALARTGLRAGTTGGPVPSWSVPWIRKPGFKLVAVKDVRRLTGLELSELLSRQNIQRLTRIDESGAREEFVRVPIELLIEEPAD